MRQDLEDARRTFERMVELEVMNLPEVCRPAHIVVCVCSLLDCNILGSLGDAV